MVFESTITGAKPVVFEASDEFAAEHYRIFCHEMVPAGSVFLEPHTMMGGAVSDEVWQFMNARGYEPDMRSIPADHLATGFHFLAFLLENEKVFDAKRFIHQHLLSWTPVYLDRLQHDVNPSITELASLVEHMFDRVLALDSEDLPNLEATFSLPVASIELHSQHTGLQDLGQFFASHAESGLFVPRSRLIAQARAHRLPTGFGSRARTIEGLFRSAGQYEEIDALCSFLKEELHQHRSVWETWSQKRYGAAEKALVRRWAALWLEKLAATDGIVDQLQTSLANAAP